MLRPSLPLDGRARLRLSFITLGLGVFSTAAILAAKSGMPLLAQDSPSYIAWSAERTPLYPLFLRLIAFVSPDYSSLPVVQYAILIAATAGFADAFACLFGWWLAGALSAMAVFGNYFVMRYPGAILPETLFLSLLLLHAAGVLHSLRDPGSKWPILAGAALGCAILARPIGYSLVAGVVWLPFAWRERRWMRSCCLGGSLGAVILAACAGNYLYRGYFE